MLSFLHFALPKKSPTCMEVGRRLSCDITKTKFLVALPKLVVNDRPRRNLFSIVQWLQKYNYFRIHHFHFHFFCTQVLRTPLERILIHKCPSSSTAKERTAKRSFLISLYTHRPRKRNWILQSLVCCQIFAARTCWQRREQAKSLGSILLILPLR